MKTSVVIFLTIMCLCVLIHSSAGHAANPGEDDTDPYKDKVLSVEEKKRRNKVRSKQKEGRGRRDVVGKIIWDDIGDDEISDKFVI